MKKSSKFGNGVPEVRTQYFRGFKPRVHELSHGGFQMDNQKVYQAAMYVRLSKEDADVGSLKAESDSIANQKSLIRNFVKDKSDIQIIREL